MRARITSWSASLRRLARDRECDARHSDPRGADSALLPLAQLLTGRAAELTCSMSPRMTWGMKTLSSADLRQSLRRIADGLAADGEPILLKVGDRPVGVIVSLRDFAERFALHAAEHARQALVDEILADRRQGAVNVEKALSGLRAR